MGNNDGCIVARSQEAKALGLQMGMPFWKVKGLVERHQIAVYSSNYALYQDMSDRVMKILNTHTSALEVYSIDEARGQAPCAGHRSGLRSLRNWRQENELCR